MSEEDPRSLGDGEDELSVGKGEQEMVGEVVGEQEGTLLRAGGGRDRSSCRKRGRKNRGHIRDLYT